MLGALLAALLLNAPAKADVPVICPEQARAYVGRDVIIQGRVDQVGFSEDGETLFLNFCGPYQVQLFNAVIFSEHLQAFPEARTWEGQTIKVRGKIKLYEDESIARIIREEGKPEIILERREQVTIDSTSTLPEGALPQGTEAAPGAVGSCLGGTDIAPVRDYDSPPRPNKIVHPRYPTETVAFPNKVEGTVTVEILIDSEGRVAGAHVIQSIPLLDPAALECVYQWTFHPAMKDGHPVPALVNAPIIFRVPRLLTLQPHRKQALGPRPARARGATLTGQIYWWHLDPEFGDFHPWGVTFKNEVYANWVVPAAAPPASRGGHVDFEFTVERDGAISSLRMLEASGSASLDEAAKAALTKSHFPALPEDYRPSHLTMKVSFDYYDPRSASSSF